MKIWKILLVCLVAAGCKSKEASSDFYRSELFRDVQLSSIFPDSKTFVDCVPRQPVGVIMKKYEREKQSPDFDLERFVGQHFDLPRRALSTFVSDVNASMEDHISSLWPVLTRHTHDSSRYSSLIRLPHAYAVPGGRFFEMYYLDSYFIMLGLQAQGNTELMRNIVDDFAYLIDSVGFVPNGNRTYYLTRSQPPFFAAMVAMLEQSVPGTLPKYLPQLEREYKFWMKGQSEAKTNDGASERVVIMPDGSILNRYWDASTTPRPEAFKEDVAIQTQSDKEPEEVYRDLRAAAESGWDFSSRFFSDQKTLSSIRTTRVVPVDLNALMFNLESVLAAAYQESGDLTRAYEFRDKAEARQKSMLKYLWNPSLGFFFDYDIDKKQITGVYSLAGMYPFYFGIGSDDQAAAAGRIIEKDFLKPGGLICTLGETGQQWDAPNGFAPLQWIAYKGLKRHNQHELATTIKTRWLKLNERVYKRTGKMMEKYNVVDTTLLGGGGEYPNQDGFGWTNGVALALLKEK